MEDLKALQDVYLVIGIGGMSFIILVIVLLHILNKVTPALLALKEDTIALQRDTLMYKDAIDNSTQAVQECARSNQNVASALALLERSMTNVEEGVKDLRKTTDKMDKKILVMDEKINNLIK